MWWRQLGRQEKRTRFDILKSTKTYSTTANSNALRRNQTLSEKILIAFQNTIEIYTVQCIKHWLDLLAPIRDENNNVRIRSFGNCYYFVTIDAISFMSTCYSLWKSLCTLALLKIFNPLYRNIDKNIFRVNFFCLSFEFHNRCIWTCLTQLWLNFNSLTTLSSSSHRSVIKYTWVLFELFWMEVRVEQA